MIPANSFLSLLSPAAPKGAKGDAPAVGRQFSALFAALGQGIAPKGPEGDQAAADAPEAKADPATLLALSLAASGKPAAHPGKSGKILPLPLPPGNPVPAAETEAEGLAAAEDDQPETPAAEQTVAAPLALLATLTPPVAAPLSAAAGIPAKTADANPALPASAPAPSAQPFATAAATLQVSPDSAAQSSAQPMAAQPRDGRPGVILQVASQPLAQGATFVAAMNPQQPVPQPTQAQAPVVPVAAPLVPAPATAAVVAELAPAETRPRQPGKVPGHAATSVMAITTANPLQAPLLADAATPFPLMPVNAAQQAPATAGQDLAAIVDRLSAAREALAPATAALSIDHAEFGALSLKFDQQADGALTVQLAAATPEAHRAISAAMGAEGGQFLSAEGQPQPQMQTPQQQQQAAAQPSTSSGTSSGSGTFAERDARSGQQPQRQDSSPRQQQAQRQPAAPRNEAQGDGIFA